MAEGAADMLKEIEIIKGGQRTIANSEPFAARLQAARVAWSDHFISSCDRMILSPHLSVHDWSCLRTELIWIYDHEPAPPSRHGVFDHREGNWAWYLRKGEVSVTGKAGIFTARAGQWLLLPSEIHRHDFSDDAVLISVRFICQWPTGANIFSSLSTAVLDGWDHPALARTARALERLVRRHFPGPHRLYPRQASEYPQFLRFQRAFFDWLEAWFQARVATGAQLSRRLGDERALRAAQFLDEANLDRRFPRASLSATVGLSLVQLSRLFRKQFNLTPVQYWERRRLEFARLSLETSEIPLKELAARLSFHSASHFTVWFKRHAGSSPGRYRAQNSPG
jgi:AraC-like DNA-binding protein